MCRFSETAGATAPRKGRRDGASLYFLRVIDSPPHLARRFFVVTCGVPNCSRVSLSTVSEELAAPGGVASAARCGEDRFCALLVRPGVHASLGSEVGLEKRGILQLFTCCVSKACSSRRAVRNEPLVLVFLALYSTVRLTQQRPGRPRPRALAYFVRC